MVRLVAPSYYSFPITGGKGRIFCQASESAYLHTCGK